MILTNLYCRQCSQPALSSPLTPQITIVYIPFDPSPIPYQNDNRTHKHCIDLSALFLCPTGGGGGGGKRCSTLKRGSQFQLSCLAYGFSLRITISFCVFIIG